MKFSTTTSITTTSSPTSSSRPSITSTTPLTTTFIANDPLPHPYPPSLPLSPRTSLTKRLLPHCSCPPAPNGNGNGNRTCDCGHLFPGLRKWLRVKRCKRGKRRATSSNLSMQLVDSDADENWWRLEDEKRGHGRGRAVVRRMPVVADPYAPSGSGSGSGSSSRSGDGSAGMKMSCGERKAERKEEKRVERCRARLERYGRRAEGVSSGIGAGWGGRVRRALSWEG